jgi:hypothetical protein
MAKETKNVTQSGHTDARTFTYSRNNTNLSFTLRTDIKQELKDFLELLKNAVVEVEAVITDKK